MKLKNVFEAKLQLIEILKSAGYKAGADHHYPKDEASERKVHAFEKALKDAGAERTKSSGTEHQYQYEVGNDTIIFDYRFGDKGLAAWWKQ